MHGDDRDQIGISEIEHRFLQTSVATFLAFGRFSIHFFWPRQHARTPANRAESEEEAALSRARNWPVLPGQVAAFNHAENLSVRQKHEAEGIFKALDGRLFISQ